MNRVITQLARPKVYLWPDGKMGPTIDLSPFVVALSYTKQLSEPVGKWSLTIAPWQGDGARSNRPGHVLHLPTLARQVRPNAVVSIGFDLTGGICCGLVDEISPTRQLGGDMVGIGLRLSGSDMAKVLVQDHIVHASLTVQDTPEFIRAVATVAGEDSALVAALPGVWGPESEATKAPVFLGASVEDVVKWALTAGPSMRVPLLGGMGGTGRPSEFILTDSSITTWNKDRLFSEAPHEYNGTVWGFIQSILDTDFYETILDSTPKLDLVSLVTGDNKLPDIRLTIRPKPFDSKYVNGVAGFGLPTTEHPGITWEELRTRIDGLKEWNIPPEHVLSTELGISDADVFSYYLLTADHELIGNPDGLKEGLFYPTVDLFTLQRCGLRSYEGRLSLVAGDIVEKQEGGVDYDSDVADSVIEYRNRLFNWYRLSEYLESGSIKVAGNDKYRVGDPVYLPWHWPMRGYERGVRFYCVSTSHEWRLGGPYTTTLRLTRGHNGSVIDTARAEIAKASTDAGLPGGFWATT